MRVARHIYSFVMAIILVVFIQYLSDWFGDGNAWITGAILYMYYRDILREIV